MTILGEDDEKQVRVGEARAESEGETLEKLKHTTKYTNQRKTKSVTRHRHDRTFYG